MLYFIDEIQAKNKYQTIRKTRLFSLCFVLLGVSAWAQDPAAVSVYEDCSKSGKTYDLRTATGTENGHTWVNLGLPSRLKWASCNIGATTPEDYGNYYAWGETTTKEDYSWATYKHANGAYNKLTKYCTNASYGDNGFTDDKTTLEPEDDAAAANWGEEWHIPTDAEWKELCEQCTWTWTTQNGVNGYQVTSKTNSNSIFLPAAGWRLGTNLNDAGSNGLYWSSSLSTDGPSGAWYLRFASDYVRRYGSNRYYGFSVRPVCPPSTNILTLHIAIAGCEKENSILCDAGQQITITAVPANEHHHFTQWSDGNTDNPRTISVTKDSTFTAEFAIDQHTIAVTCDPQQGTVTGAGTYDYGTQVTLTATANTGYKFEHWSNGVKDNPYLFTATEDITIEAQFTRSPATAVNNIPADGDTAVRKVFRDGQVFILRNGKTYTTTGVEVK